VEVDAVTTLGVWWYLHEHPSWALVYLLVVLVLAPRAVAVLVHAIKRAPRP
jgi:hypothetical protein